MNEVILGSLEFLVELIIRLLLASICGYLIGFERNNRKKEAGIRTHIIVAIASCLMMEISKYGFADIGKSDGARLAAQVVSGIGFLGAGMIFVHKNSVKGLTTAAGIWATSGIGMAVGAGMYVIGIVTTLIILFLQFLFHKNLKFLRHINFENIVFVVEDKYEHIEDIISLLKANDLECGDISIAKPGNGEMRIEVSAIYHSGFDMIEFIKIAAREEYIKSICNE
ncbi:MAG: MgtC/SapB family protein [Ruminococcaceae bacterium]|nr:MgtC/SapB family protein [Oscillospiraceae bacterium]